MGSSSKLGHDPDFSASFQRKVLAQLLAQFWAKLGHPDFSASFQRKVLAHFWAKLGQTGPNWAKVGQFW